MADPTGAFHAVGESQMPNSTRTTAQKWLDERVTKGNWLDIKPDQEIIPEITGWMKTVAHMHQLAFSPEIRIRRDKNDLSDDFILWAAQLIQPHDGGQIIRLNDEVRGVPYIRVGRPVEKGEPIQLADLANLEAFDLLDEELDSGHFTIFWTGTGWIGTFDFRSGRAKCLSLIEKASSFISASRISIENNLPDPATDSLYTACELLAKTHLNIKSSTSP